MMSIQTRVVLYELDIRSSGNGFKKQNMSTVYLSVCLLYLLLELDDLRVLGLDVLVEAGDLLGQHVHLLSRSNVNSD